VQAGRYVHDRQLSTHDGSGGCRHWPSLARQMPHHGGVDVDAQVAEVLL
jgi:hypothetical protein